MIKTRLPARANAAAMLVQMVVLPVPPFCPPIVTIILLSRPRAQPVLVSPPQLLTRELDLIARYSFADFQYFSKKITIRERQVLRMPRCQTTY